MDHSLTSIFSSQRSLALWVCCCISRILGYIALALGIRAPITHTSQLAYHYHVAESDHTNNTQPSQQGERKGNSGKLQLERVSPTYYAADNQGLTSSVWRDVTETTLIISGIAAFLPLTGF